MVKRIYRRIGDIDIREYPEYSIENLLVAFLALFLVIWMVGIMTIIKLGISEGMAMTMLGMVGSITVFSFYRLWLSYLRKKSRDAISNMGLDNNDT